MLNELHFAQPRSFEVKVDWAPNRIWLAHLGAVQAALPGDLRSARLTFREPYMGDEFAGKRSCCFCALA